MEVVVTKAWLAMYCASQPRAKVVNMVGRALLALYARQTQDEQHTGHTRYVNGRGFNGFDAAIGSSMAQQFARSHSLSDRQLAVWTGGRLLKYARQLNEVAQEKASR